MATHVTTKQLEFSMNGMALARDAERQAKALVETFRQLDALIEQRTQHDKAA